MKKLENASSAWHGIKRLALSMYMWHQRGETIGAPAMAASKIGGGVKAGENVWRRQPLAAGNQWRRQHRNRRRRRRRVGGMAAAGIIAAGARHQPAHQAAIWRRRWRRRHPLSTAMWRQASNGVTAAAKNRGGEEMALAAAWRRLSAQSVAAQLKRRQR